MAGYPKRLRQMRSVVALVGLLVAAPSLPAAGPSFATALAECTSCHGEAGVSRNNDTPHLAGQVQAYLVEAMLALQKGRWGTSIPWHVPAGYSPDLIGQLAGHFAAQPQPSAAFPADAADSAAVERGSQVYEARCTGCHEDQGRESDRRGLDSPRLAGQPQVYLANQIREFLAGRRPFRSYLMARAYSGLTEAQVEDVALFFAAQPTQVQPEPMASASGKRRRLMH